MEGITIKGGVVMGSSFEGANMIFADMSGLDRGNNGPSDNNFEGADLSHANLSNSNMTDSNFDFCNLTDTNWSGAATEGSTFYGAKGNIPRG